MLETKRLSRLGTGVSLACAVHCAATPLLVAALPLAGHHFPDAHWLVIPLVGAAALIGYTTLGWGYRRHNRPLPLILLTLGLLLLLAGHTVLPAQVSVVAATVGALTLAGAQLLNWRYPRSCCPHG